MTNATTLRTSEAPAITFAEFVEMLKQSGGFLVVGEYRGSKIDSGTMTDETTGKVRKYCSKKHVVEIQTNGQTESVQLVEYQPDGTRVEDLTIPAIEKGSRVLARCQSSNRKKGFVVSIIPDTLTVVE